MADIIILTSNDATEIKDFIGMHKEAGEKVFQVTQADRVKLLGDDGKRKFWPEETPSGYTVIIAVSDKIDML